MSKKIENAGTVRQLKEVPGLFSCLLEHKVVHTSAQFKWGGPKIPEEEWHKVLSFFQWSYDTAKSETQVRGYVNVALGTWKFWAYPQEADTGMSAKELEDHPDFAAQRLQFNPDEGWRYFATIHHHCATGAFQSGTDRRNEQNQDGLHITVGNMNSKNYSMHERFYLCGHLIPHDLSWFWSIGGVMDNIPDWAAKLLPLTIKDQIARGQMCDKSPPGVGFPKQWQDNVIYKKTETITLPAHYQFGLGYNQNTKFKFQRIYSNSNYGLLEARRQLDELCLELHIDDKDAFIEMEEILTNDAFLVKLIAIMYRNDVSLEALAGHIAAEFLEGGEKAGQNDGVPDYQGKESPGGLPE